MYIYICNDWLVGLKLNSKTTQVHYSAFHAFGNQQVYIYFIYFFLKEKIIEQKCYSNKIFKNENSTINSDGGIY